MSHIRSGQQTEEVLERVADAYYEVDDRKEAVFRRDETSHVKHSGSGFGLFFVDTMVTAYGGTVRVEDNDPRGTRFVLELPRHTDGETPMVPHETTHPTATTRSSR